MKAATDFAQACRYAPREPLYWLNQAVAAEKLGQRVVSRAAVSKAKTLDTSDPDLRRQIAEFDAYLAAR